MKLEEPSIQLVDVSVEFPIFNVNDRSFRHAILGKTKLIKKSQDPGTGTLLRALDSVSIAISQGERVGLIGKNGAGKSTLLQIMAGIYVPVAGQINVKGTVSSMLNLGFGMRDDLSGWENIQLVGLINGMCADQIEKERKEIADFSELGEYLFLPVSTYSAGMRARLAFSITASVKSDILLVDEVFGAGDAAFTEKAATAMEEKIRSSEIMVFASHSDELIKRFCERGILLEDGKVKFDGCVEGALKAYHKI